MNKIMNFDIPIRSDEVAFHNLVLDAETNIVLSIRKALYEKKVLIDKPSKPYNFHYDPEISQVYVSLFQTGLQSIRWGSKRDTFESTLERCATKLKEHETFYLFDVKDANTCRIMVEVIINEQSCDIKKLTQNTLDNNRFEVGIDGLKLSFQNSDYYYLPTDATVKSHLSLKEVFNFFAKKIGLQKYTDSISKRIEILKLLDLKWSKIHSIAFISYEEHVFPLHRGLVIPENVTFETLLHASKQSIKWALDNQKENGQFLYYYDCVKDSEVDHEHPKMLNPTYYNMLRHSGGIIALLHMYSVEQNAKYLLAVEEAIEYLLTQTMEEEINGEAHAYVMCNEKAKLGGSGIALVALMMHLTQSGNKKYLHVIEALCRHTLSRVDTSGEMIGYYIHPDYYDGSSIIDPTENEKRELFSFYYPGEALLGLALYFNETSIDNPKLKNEIAQKAKLALDFLLYERPKKYPDMFASLPSDSWLMQAIEAWAKNEEFQKKAYLDFVYNDAKSMIRQMYTPKNAPYFDYIGAYFYYYGEHAYPDAARSEGLVAAYNLAIAMNNTEIAAYLLPNLKLAAKNMMYVFNNKASSYMHLYPKKTLGSFRLKFTRQWTRIDMTQHAVSFFVRFVKVIHNE